MTQAYARAPIWFAELGWSNKTQPKKAYRAPSGVTTVSHSKHGVPFKYDIEVCLYLANQAALQGRVMRGTVRDLRQWLDANRRKSDVLRRLHRVLGCEVLFDHADDTYKRRTFGTLHRFEGDEFVIIFDETFVQDAREGFMYSIHAACRLRNRNTALSLYLGILAYVHQVGHDRDYTHDYDPYKKLPRPRSRFKAAQTLCRDIQEIRQFIQGEIEIRPNAIRLGVVIDFGTPRRYTRAGAGSLQEYQARDRRARVMPPIERRAAAKLERRYEDLERRTARLEASDAAQHAIRERLAKMLEQTATMTHAVTAVFSELSQQQRGKNPAEPKQ